MRRQPIAIPPRCCVAAATLGRRGPGNQVDPARPRRPRLRVLPASDAFENEEIRDAIHSGLTITFVYDVELRRSAAGWLDRTIQSSTVSAGVRFDNLARRYHVTLNADGRTEDSRTLERESLAREWLTRFDRLDLFSKARLEPNAEDDVRVRARTTPRNASFVWPWQGTDVSGLAKFTFLR